MLTIVSAESAEDRAAVFVIRGAVFVAEQNVPIEEEWDARDQDADYLLARLDGIAVGTVRLVADGDQGILGRLAVLPRARGGKTGAALVRALEERAREQGLTAIELHAQTHAVEFYRKLGYTVYGAEFLDAGIPHRHMRKGLR